MRSLCKQEIKEYSQIDVQQQIRILARISVRPIAAIDMPSVKTNQGQF